MSLAKRLSEASTTPKIRLCKLGVLLAGDSLSKEDKKYLIEALNTREGVPGRLTNTDIGVALREEKHDISNSAVDRHRRGSCGCPKEEK
jgi:hypothetical protein